MCILMVDDEPAALKLLQRAVTTVQPEAEIAAFTSAEQMLDHAAAMPEAPDVAFLDVEMPEMSGLEAAKRLTEKFPYVNIIFVTGYAEYAVEAMQLRVSGYLLKPASVEDVREELEDLRHPIGEARQSRIFARAFGTFALLVDGEPVRFRREKAQEMLACLIDRHGATTTRKELAAVLYPDEPYTRKVQSHLSKDIESLQTVLARYDISDLLIVGYNAFAVRLSRFACDAYDYLRGDPDALDAFDGTYMQPYEWGEDSTEKFYN